MNTALVMINYALTGSYHSGDNGLVPQQLGLGVEEKVTTPVKHEKLRPIFAQGELFT